MADFGVDVGLIGGKTGTAAELVMELEKVCVPDSDAGLFAQLWVDANSKRQSDEEYDHQLIEEGVLEFLRFALQHEDPKWRLVGIRVAVTFLYMPDVVSWLRNLAFAEIVVMISLPHEGDDYEADELAEIQTEGQALAAEVFNLLADNALFYQSLVCSSVLVFLSTCLTDPALHNNYRVHELVTRCMRKLAQPQNVQILEAESIDYILATYFKGIDLKQPKSDVRDYDVKFQDWTWRLKSVANATHVITAMTKEGYVVPVDLTRILTTCKEIACVPLWMEFIRLLFWKCKSSNNVLADCKEASPDGDAETTVEILSNLWNNQVLVMYHELQQGEFDANIFATFCKHQLGHPIADDDVEQKNTEVYRLVCFLNSLFLLFAPVPELRRSLQKFKVSNLHLAFQLKGDPFYRDFMISTSRHLLHIGRTQEFGDMAVFLGSNVIKMLDEAIQEANWTERLFAALIEALMVMSLERGMQELMTKVDIFPKLMAARDVYHLSKDTELAILRIFSCVAMLPSNFRDADHDNTVHTYPPRADAMAYLKDLAEHFGHYEDILSHTNVLLVALQKREFSDKQKEEMPGLITTLSEWWAGSSSSRYNFEKALIVAGETVAEDDLFNIKAMKETHLYGGDRPTYIIDVCKYSAPFQSCAVLAFLGRLALEPDFKSFFLRKGLIGPLVGSLKTSIWGEAREAISCIANLLWNGTKSQKSSKDEHAVASHCFSLYQPCFH